MIEQTNASLRKQPLSEFVRAFLAFDLDDPNVKKKLANMQALALQTGADLKLVETENIHMTIRFLGDIQLHTAEKIHAEMQQVKFNPFPVQLLGIGVFPNVNFPRVLWAGIGQGAHQLQDVFNQMEPKLQNIGFPPDRNAFSPHLTIARVRSGRNKAELATFVEKSVNYDFGTVLAACLRLKRSQLTPNGPIYSTLKEYCPK